MAIEPMLPDIAEQCGKPKLLKGGIYAVTVTILLSCTVQYILIPSPLTIQLKKGANFFHWNPFAGQSQETT